MMPSTSINQSQRKNVKKGRKNTLNIGTYLGIKTGPLVPLPDTLLTMACRVQFTITVHLEDKIQVSALRYLLPSLKL